MTLVPGRGFGENAALRRAAHTKKRGRQLTSAVAEAFFYICCRSRR